MGSIILYLYRAKWLVLGVVLLLIVVTGLRPFLDAFVYSIFLYYITRPIKDILQPHIKERSLLVTISLLLIALPIVAVIVYTILLGISELSALLQEGAIASGIQLQPYVNLRGSMDEILRQLFQTEADTGNLSGLSGGSLPGFIPEPYEIVTALREVAITAGVTVLNVLFQISLVFLLAFFLLRDGTRLWSWFSSAFPGLVREHDSLLERYWRNVDDQLQRIFFGNLLSVIFFAFVAIAVFYILNMFVPPELQIPFPFLLGLLCGLAAFIPVLGMWTVLVPLFLYLAFSALRAGTLVSDIFYLALIIAVVAIFVDVIPDYIIRPFIARGTVSAGLLMFAFIFGPTVFGISGVFLGAIVLVLAINYLTVVLPDVMKEKIY